MAAVVRTSCIIPVLVACALLGDCGGVYFVGFVSNPGGGATVTGIVSGVNSGFVSDPTGAITPFTEITFMNTGIMITVKFCGDQRQWFPMNQHVKVEYIPGVLCNILLNVEADDGRESKAHSGADTKGAKSLGHAAR